MKRRLAAASVAVAVASTCFLSACAIPQVPFRTVYEDPVNFVRLEIDPSAAIDIPESWHSHPVQISPEVMVSILKGFRVQEHRTKLQRMFGGDAPWEPAFRDEEVSLLAPKLVEALARAEPRERVTYYLSRPQTSIKREITSGGLYVDNDLLHFILGNHRIVYGIPAYGMVYDRRYPMRPTAAKGFDLSFEPTAAVVKPRRRLWDRLLGREKDELVINLRSLPAVRPVVQTIAAVRETVSRCRPECSAGSGVRLVLMSLRRPGHQDVQDGTTKCRT